MKNPIRRTFTTIILLFFIFTLIVLSGYFKYEQKTQSITTFSYDTVTEDSTKLRVINVENTKLEMIDKNILRKLKEMDKKVFIPIKTVLQNPELPNGCEITSLTAVLNFYGFKVSKTAMADQYLPKAPIEWKDEKRFGPNPYIAYAGNPRLSPGGWFSYAPPIVVAAQNYFQEQVIKFHPKDISSSTMIEIIDQLDQGIPVVIWVTKNLDPPIITTSWYFHENGEFFEAPINLHCVVLDGYEENIVHVMDPLKGQVTYDMNAFFNSYFALGSHAMVVGRE